MVVTTVIQFIATYTLPTLLFFGLSLRGWDKEHFVFDPFIHNGESSRKKRELIANASHRMSSSKKEWKKIGVLKKIIVYPIDGCAGLEVLNAYCTPHGLASGTCLRDGYQDRAIVAYNKNTGKVLLRDPVVAQLQDYALFKDIRNVLGQLNLNSLPEVHNVYYPVWENGRKTIFSAHDMGNIISHRLCLHFRDTKDCKDLAELALRLGYRKPEQRSRNNEYLKLKLKSSDRSGFDIDGYAANFSSYSLVDDKHITDLIEKTGIVDLTYRNFNPNLVIQSNGINYLEENVVAVKIGHVEFSNITPLSHGSTLKNKANDNLLRFLQTNRSASVLYPGIIKNTDAPFFGLNMELTPDQYARQVDNKYDPFMLIMEEDVVYVQLK